MTRSPRYKCLVVDHDDTAVDSTPPIHYPAYVDALAKLRPGVPALSLDEYLLCNHRSGFTSFLRETLQFTEADMDFEYKNWRRFAAERTPKFFDGVGDLLKEHVAAGGYFVVSSLNEEDFIRRHYEAAFGSSLQPSLVYGWVPDSSKNKPNAWPVLDAAAKLGVKLEDVAVLDDSSAGVVMARAAGVAAIGVGWSHSVKEIHDDMRQRCDAYFTTVQDLREWLYL
eukprot:m51a1_g9366 hypothetical protein (225) ;mRNA; r:182137-183036